MSTPILATKLYIPPARSKAVRRPRLIARLNEGLQRKLTLISAPAGFGKTTLVSEWIQTFRQGGPEAGTLWVPETRRQGATSTSTLPVSLSPPLAVAWLSLDEGDNDPIRFLTYFVAALQTVAVNIGEGVLAALQSPQPPREPSGREAILTALLNEITTIADNFVLVLDDYHVIDAGSPLGAVDSALTFLLEHLPPQMHLVIATREDPQLPLARLRARAQLTELRATDLRFTPTEAADFLNQVMGLKLAAEEIAALETRTEGWVAGLQLAAISLQGHQDTGQQDAGSFIKSFTGSHRFVMDYLVEEVLQQQSASVQAFLLRTSILDRLCGPLCDAVLRDPSASGQEILEYIEHANLFIVPLDNERRWYRYHHLFADLLRQRLQQSTALSIGDEGKDPEAPRGLPPAEYHRRASQWYEDNGLEIEAFHHAVAAHDVAHAERLIEGKGMPLQFRGAATPILNWLASLPTTVLDASPLLWVTYASALLVIGQVTGVEEKVQAAEVALQDIKLDRGLDDKNKDLVGRIASIRATLAVTQHQVETIIAQARRALAYLHPDNLPVRTSITWTLGYAYHLQGDRAAARLAYTEAISICQAIGHTTIAMIATIGLGNIQETENQLYLATETYRQVLQLVGDSPPPPVCDAYLGLARICYQWNDLDTAQQYAQKSLPLARQIENTDRFVLCEIFLARLKLALGDVAGAAALLAKAGQFARQHNFVHRMAEVAAAQVLTLLHQGDLNAAAQLAHTHELSLSLARVHLAQGDPSTALAALEPLRRQVEAKGWADEQLKVMVLQAVAYHAHGEMEKAAQLLGDALVLAEPDGFIRLFVDEGPPMAELLTRMRDEGGRPVLSKGEGMKEYIHKLLAAFATQDKETRRQGDKEQGMFAQGPVSLSPGLPISVSLIEPLSQREVEVLQLIAQGLSNHEISKRLFLALDTVKGHNRKIYGKLQVQRRTEAVAKARSLNLLPLNP